jgi:multicomponent Na+:H+ antiporter subunit D
VLVFAIGQPGRRRDQPVFHPVYLVMTAGVALSLLTGDLFNLFVAYEITLACELRADHLGGRREQSPFRHDLRDHQPARLDAVRDAIAWIYAATGTVNMADLCGQDRRPAPGAQRAVAVPAIPACSASRRRSSRCSSGCPTRTPPRRHRSPPCSPGLLTKVGVYSIIRTQTLLFPESRPRRVLLVIAGLTMVVGVLGAIAQNDMKRILSFHIVSQIGYMVLGLGLFTVAGVAGAVLFLVHQIVVKTALFLAAGLVEDRAGHGAQPRRRPDAKRNRVARAVPAGRR